MHGNQQDLDCLSQEKEIIEANGENMIKTAEWILCPVCGSKTRDRLREDTVLKNYPLYCPKCKQETLINAKELHITVIKEPDAQTQSR